ncbi:hypothetical protein MesoLjLc_15530 [Mesorhizobium sp. L-8-10]|nr:hypothetical protein MesoLjLc_15530 [Mesorhizobium sp. L-8-10]
MWLAVFVVVLFGGYSAGWFYMADRLEAEAARAVADLNKDGVTAECANLNVRGFPFRIGLYCDSLGYEDGGRSLFAAAGSLRSAAQVYQPSKAVAELDGPLRVSAPGIAPLWLDWDSLRASVRIATPLPERVSVATDGLSGMTDPEEGDPVSLFSAGKAEMHLRPNGTDVDWAGNFTELEIDPGIAGGRTLPMLNGSGDVTLKDGVALIRSGARGLRGRSAEIRNLDLSSGEGGVSVSGPISVAADGLIDASLTIRLRNPPAVSALLVGAFPEARSQIESAMAGLALLGREPSLPLRIVRGKATLGFIPLGDLPPVAR